MNIQQINFARKHAAYCNYYRNFASKRKIVGGAAAAGALGLGIPAAVYGGQWLGQRQVVPQTVKLTEHVPGATPRVNTATNWDWQNRPFNVVQAEGKAAAAAQLNPADPNFDPTLIPGSRIGGGQGQLDLSKWQTSTTYPEGAWSPLAQQGVHIENGHYVLDTPLSQTAELTDNIPG